MTPSRYFVEPEEAAKTPTTVVCANCSRPGHKWDRCPLPSTRCTLCGAFGHDNEVRVSVVVGGDTAGIVAFYVFTVLVGFVVVVAGTAASRVHEFHVAWQGVDLCAVVVSPLLFLLLRRGQETPLFPAL